MKLFVARWAPRTTPMPRRAPARAWRTGSARMSACSPPSAACRSSWSADNLKAAVIKRRPLRAGAEPHLPPRWRRTTARPILPARPRKPRDKAKVEVAVLVAQRWILARLRNRRFFSLAELNAAIRRLLDELNARVMRGFGASRAELFATLDRPALRAAAGRSPTTSPAGSAAASRPDYHVEVDGPLVLGAVPPDPRRWWMCASPRRTRRGVPPRRARRQPSPRRRHRRGHSTDARAHAERAPPARPVDARPDAAAGGRGSALRRWRFARRSWRPGRIPSRASAPASASWPWPGPMAPPGSRPPAGAAAASGRAPSPRSAPSCRTASTGPSWRRRPSRAPAAHGNIRGGGYLPLSTGETPCSPIPPRSA